MSNASASQIGLEESRLASKAEDDQFTALVRVHARLLFRIAYAWTRNVQDAEDVVQDTFLKIYRTQAWRKMSDEKAFLARTVWRVAQDKLGRRRRDLPLPPSSPAVGPEEAAIQMNSDAQVHRLIDALPEELRQPLALSTLEELSSREIGELMGIPEGTVRTRLMRARQILKEKLLALREGQL